MSQEKNPDKEKTEQIQRTADVVSQIRYREAQKENPLVTDPFAYLFISPEAEQMLEKGLQKWPFFAEYLVLREKFFDDQLAAFFNEENSGQVVILGTGNDMRAERLPFLKNKKIFEVDLPDKIKLKQAILLEAFGILPKQVAYIDADVSKGDFMEIISNRGFNAAKKTAFILQGLIYYLSPEGVDNVFEKLIKVFTPDDLLLLDQVSTDLSEYPPYPGDPIAYLSARGFIIKKSALLGNLTNEYFGKTYKERWWVITAGSR